MLASVVLIAACAAVLAAPGTAPQGRVLDVVSNGAAGGFASSGPESIAVGGAARTPGAGTVALAPDGSATAGDIAGSDPLMAARFRPTAPPIASLTGYVWPIAHPRLTLPYGPTPLGARVVNGQLFHDGVDLATFCGDRIGAAHAGTVLAAGRRYDRVIGWIGDLEPYLAWLDAKQLWMTVPIVVVIDDGNGYRSIYAHFSRVVVTVGEHVRAGQLLGYEGMTGHASGCHLHYSLFSPLERATFGVDPAMARRMSLPIAEIARVDPMLVFPPRAGLNAPTTPSPAPPSAASRAAS